MKNLQNIIRDLNLFKNYINTMIVCYLFLTILNVILCGIISLNGYTDKHVYLSFVIIISNIINAMYYTILRSSMHGIFGKRPDSMTITNHLHIIKTVTYLDIFINLSIFVILTTLFILWVGEKSEFDRDILIFEYCLNITINITSIFVCVMTLKELRNIFNPINYQINNSFNVIHTESIDLQI